MQRLKIYIFSFFLIVNFSVVAETVEFNDHLQFVNSAGNLDITTFDNLAAQMMLSEVEFNNMIINSRGGSVVNPQDFSPGLLVGGSNVNSQEHGISASLTYNSSGAIEFDNLDDNFEFILKANAHAAGLWIGNLGANNNDSTTTTIVSFFDSQGNLLASKNLTQVTTGIIGSGANNRIFYGIVTDQSIKSFTVENSSFDNDGIILDDIQFSAILLHCSEDSAIGTVSPDLDIHMPSLNYQSLGGIQNLWADFEYYGQGENGELLWKLKEYGVNQEQ